MEITSIVGHVTPPAGRLAGEAVGASRAPGAEAETSAPDIDIDQIAEDLRIVSSAFNHRLEFSINRELDLVVVKVIDKQTDKVIKELPPEEIQRLHVRIGEAIGLLIDEEI
ncbi:MAG: flagellar protein FlaG [Spirochaetales bacterium]|nr:flagellar protein FlaG [Spirochaetales bacterium]